MIFVIFILIFSIIVVFEQSSVFGLHKVIVPSVYDEWSHGSPHWARNVTLMNEFNYSVFLYQKKDPSLPHYISTNRGRENSVYYRYIVDHYDNFPDVAVFVHGRPYAHSPRFIDLVGCISPNASYLSINNEYLTRNTNYWARVYHADLWIEQCFRDALSVAWNLSVSQLSVQCPVNRPISVRIVCCQQFLISRATVHRRSLATWKKLLAMLGENSVCHEGEPDYEYLHSYDKSKVKVGPEPSNLPDYDTKSPNGTGRLTQAVTSEHLSHVIFGFKDISDGTHSEEEKNQNLDPTCVAKICAGYQQVKGRALGFGGC